jgi:hypothetical protein
LRVSRTGSAIFIAALLCAVAAFKWTHYVASEAPPAHITEATSQPRASENGVAVLVDKNAPPPRSQEKQPPAGSTDYAVQLHAATDYLDFIRMLLPAARAGDVTAQFNVFRALDYCAIEYHLHIDRGGIRRTLDDALRTAAGRWPYDSETVRQIYARCHALVESGANEIGERSDWLRRATEGGYPLAQAIASHRIPDSSISGESEELANSEDSRRLLASAIRSGDPRVLWEIGGFGLAPKSDELDIPDQAWLLAACQRGLDCAPQSDQVRAMCTWDPGCQPYESVADVLRRADGTGYPELEARARWINEKIDVGDWAALGF